MKIIRAILSSSHFENKPPVLIDIGASGEINKKWKKIAPYSICIAFDADDREFNVSEKQASGYKKLLVINRIVTAQESPTAEFYLAESPFCSSLLKPDLHKLKPWVFQSLFTVKKTMQLPAITLTKAIKQAGIDYIDWFKTDTQGTDLRLFLSVSDAIRQNILAAEFEPGIMDAYIEEDKLFTLMQEMHGSGYWLSTMEVKGTQRLNDRYLKEFGSFSGKRMVRKSPCWAELTYLQNATSNNTRQLLLLYIFALLERQYGFALEVCDTALQQSNEPIFSTCKKAILQQMRKEKRKLPLVILKKQFNKLFANINA
ncbi:MAG: hypothetical protein ABIN89_31390 [Chitinophagaceae bacterium]